MEYLAHVESDRKQKLIDHLIGSAEIAGSICLRHLMLMSGVIAVDCYMILVNIQMNFKGNF